MVTMPQPRVLGKNRVLRSSSYRFGVGGEASEPEEWSRRRREALQAHVERMAQARSRETARARELIADFVLAATRRGVSTRPLLARPGERPPTYRTGLVGWYLNRDGSLAVTPDGGFYVLVTASSLLGRVRGVTLRPADPPLQVGAGARDGESIALDVLLALRLDAGDDWPIHGT
jgi:hypothetical protein